MGRDAELTSEADLYFFDRYEVGPSRSRWHSHVCLKMRALRCTRLVILLCGAAFVAAAGACGRQHPPDPAHDVDIVASDGVVLKASYYSSQKSGPGILLIHQCNRDRHAWDSLTPDLVAAGFHVLTFDQRGFGGTKGPADQQKTVGDADAALAYLLSKPDVDNARIAVGGASCGVGYSAALASRRPEIKALVLLSGWTDDAARAFLAATPSIAVFGAAADRSGSDAADIREAVAASRHPGSTARIVRGGAHGVEMFETDADLKGATVKSLEMALPLDTQAPPSSPVQAASSTVPDDCPVLIVTRSGGLGTESQGGIVVAIWESGYVLRAESPARPSGPHVIGRVETADLAAVSEVAKHSPLWTMRSGGVGVDIPSETIELQRGNDRLGWAETPGLTATKELAALQASLFKVRIQQAARIVGPIETKWKCPSVRWSR